MTTPMVREGSHPSGSRLRPSGCSEWSEGLGGLAPYHGRSHSGLGLLPPFPEHRSAGGVVRHLADPRVDPGSEPVPQHSTFHRGL